MPIPGPIWSTTAPSVLASNGGGAPVVVPSASSIAKEVLEFEWEESQKAASYNWWFGFLKTLDDANNAEDYSKFKYSLGNNALLNGSCFGKIGEEVGGFVGANDHQSPSPDEWLLFPTADEDEPSIP